MENKNHLYWFFEVGMKAEDKFMLVDCFMFADLNIMQLNKGVAFLTVTAHPPLIPICN